jgi:hypothetical protein
LSDAPEDAAVRLGPAAINLLRSVWRQKQLVILGLVLGLGLGLVALPKVLGSSSSYQASVRIALYASPVDAAAPSPAYFAVSEGAEGISTDALKDIAVAEETLKKVAPADSELTPTQLLERLSFSPVSGTPYVDASYTDGSARFASAVVTDYAQRLVRKQNDEVEKRFTSTMSSLHVGGSQAEKAAIEAKRAELEFAYARWPGNSVVSVRPVVTTLGPPLSRSVTLALGLLFGLAIGVGAGLLVETAFRKVTSPVDAEEAAGLPFVAAVSKSGTRRAPLPVIDRPFSPAAEDYRRVGTALERQGLGSDVRVLAIVSATYRYEGFWAPMAIPQGPAAPGVAVRGRPAGVGALTAVRPCSG